MTFASLLKELRAVKPEVPLEPELKHQRLKQDAQIREEQDLRAGAIMLAVVEEGEGEGTPGPDDLVYVHVTVRTDDQQVCFSTHASEGGNGQPIAFMIEKGQRAPRAWEIAVKSMKRKQILALKVKPGYAWDHPDCKMPVLPGVPRGELLHFELQLVAWHPSARPLPMAESSYKRTVEDGSGWETPRPPMEVTLCVMACCPSHDGVQMSGQEYFATGAEPLVTQLGAGLLPQGVEEALACMSVGERCVVVVPAAKMAPPRPGALMPGPPPGAAQVEVSLRLVSLVQLRDLAGDGTAFKKRVADGDGEFPVDCPVQDTTVRIHYRVAQLALADDASLASALSSNISGGGSGGVTTWAYDTRGTGDGEPMEFDTGVGEVPWGLEMAIKLMVPGETSLVACAPERAYVGRSDAPDGIDPSVAVLFEVTLVSFDRHAHWQNMSFEERWELADKLKAKANELYRARRHEHARAAYERLLRMLDSTRDYETEVHVERTDALKLNMLSNLTLACFQQEDYIQAVTYATRALDFDPDSAKLLLRRARALSMKGDFEAADTDLDTAANTLPAEELAKEIDAERAANKRREKAAGAKQRQAFRNFFDR